MTQRISRHGTRYTEGSHGTWGEHPRVCSGCGAKLTLSMTLWLETSVDAHGRETKRSWHTACRPRPGVCECGHLEQTHDGGACRAPFCECGAFVAEAA